MPERVARVRIELQGTSPKVWRRVDVPLSYTLLSMHEVIQAAFEWNGGHLYEFIVDRERFSDPALEDTFEPDGIDLSPRDAGRLRLQTLVDLKIKRFDYIYDFGDNWHHILTILRVIDANPASNYPALVAGSCCSPIDDVGGIWGFYDLADAAADPKHPARQQYEEWLGEEFVKHFDLKHFDRESVRTRIAMVAEAIA